MVRKQSSPELVPREHILRIAAAHFASEGFAGPRVDAIAADAGLNKALLYYHVGNKQKLYAEVFHQVLDHALPTIAGVIAAHDDPATRYRAIIDAIVGVFSARPEFPRILLREIASGGAHLPEEVLQKIGSLFAGIASVLREGHDRGVFRETDPVLTHMITAGSMMLLIAGAPIRQRIRALPQFAGLPFAEQEPSAMATLLADLLLNGLSAREVEPRTKRRGSS